MVLSLVSRAPADYNYKASERCDLELTLEVFRGDLVGNRD